MAKVIGIKYNGECEYCKLHIRSAKALFKKNGLVKIRIQKAADGTIHIFCLGH